MAELIKESKAYIYRIRKYIWGSFAIFILAAAGGAYFAHNFPEETAEYLRELEEFFNSMDTPTQWQTFLSILQNNAEVMFMTIGLGLIAGLFPLFFLLTNGFIIGVMGYIFFAQGLGLVFMLGILPHGILELPAMFFSAAIGFKLGKSVLGKLFGSKSSIIYEMSEGIKFAVTVILPFLIMAAFIESYITPYFIALAQFFLEVL